MGEKIKLLSKVIIILMAIGFVINIFIPSSKPSFNETELDTEKIDSLAVVRSYISDNKVILKEERDTTINDIEKLIITRILNNDSIRAVLIDTSVTESDWEDALKYIHEIE